MKYTDLCARLDADIHAHEVTGNGDLPRVQNTREAAAAIRELETCNAILTNLAIEAERVATYERKRAEAAEARVAELTRERDAVEALVKAAEPDYCYDEDWEYTMRWDEWPDLVDSHDLTKPVAVYTLQKGPTKWVVRVPTDGDDSEVRMFDSKDAAIRELEAARDKNWSEYLSERDARMASNMREATWQARAEAAEAKVARLEGEVTALEWFSETSAANAIAVKKHLDDLNKSAALTEGTPTEYERKVAQMKEDFPNGI